MSNKGQNFLQSWWEGYKNFDPAGAIQNRVDEDKVISQDRNDYLEDQYVDRLDPTKPERGVKPTLVEEFLLGVNRNDFKDAGGRINIRDLKKTAIGEEAEALGLTINPDSKETKLQRRVDRRKKENKYNALSTKNPDLDVTKLSDSQLAEEYRKSNNTLTEQETYGVVGPDGRTRTGGTVDGQIKLDQAAGAKALNDETIAHSKATTRINQGNLDLSRVNAENTQTLNLYDRDVDKYRYEDGKYEKGIDRQFEADREDARFAANLKNIQAQNAAEMDRYELMLQNDREVRQGDSISDLMAALTMLGGAFLL